MKNICLFLLSLTFVGSYGQQPVDLANSFTSTIKPRFDYFASATLPYGMVALSPDTHHGDLWNAGYRYNDPYILNFSHVHNAQTAGIPVMPVVGPSKALQGLAASRSAFSHTGEVAGPGYHKVLLADYGITAELTASQRTGFHRYTFPAAKEAHVIMDLTAALGPVKMLYGYAGKISNTEIEGYSVMAPTIRRKKNCTVYFYARFSRPFDAVTFWKQSEKDPQRKERVAGENQVGDAGAGVYASYHNMKAGEQVMLQVGISFVSMENAKMNLQAELPDWNFERVHAAARESWNGYLGRIVVAGGTLQHRVKFYTDLMHTAVGRRCTEDVNGEYTDNTGPSPVIRKVPVNANGKPAYHFLDADGLWGSQWNLNILWAMLYPEYGNDIAKTFLSFYENAGMMSRSSWGGNYSFVMVGDQTTPLLSALMQTGQATFNQQLAWRAAHKNAFPGGIRDRAGYEAGPSPKGGGMDWYLQYGYVPVEIMNRGAGFHRGGAAMTLEYAYQDWCLAQMAHTLGKKDQQQLFLERSASWKHLFDPSTGWMRPKDTSGNWASPFAPVTSKTSFNAPGFIESSSAVYTFYVPQDVKELIRYTGGPAAFAKKLEESFQKSVPTRFAALHGEHGGAWVDYDNQPSCHMAHLFSYAGMPWKTQYWVRQVHEKTFGDTAVANGYPGDEDQGQMGGLSALMAIGLFDVQGLADARPTLEITSPVFDKTILHLPGGKQFVIETKYPAGKDNTYIQSARLNGAVWNRYEFPYEVLAKGGLLELTLGASPNKRWGVGK